jgi:superfamily I DNA/RNA helicase
MLAAAGKRVVLITHSNLLRQYTSHANCLPDSFQISTFHRWIQSFWQENFGSNPPIDEEEEWAYDWLEMERECIRTPPEKPSWLIVDEGQDLPRGFYEFCSILPVHVTVFADEEQSIGEKQSTLAEIAQELGTSSAFLVTEENHRNTREIALLASKYLVKSNYGPPPFPLRTGPKPCITHDSSPAHFLNQLAQYIRAHPQEKIGIICRTSRLQREIQNQLAERGLESLVQSYISNDPTRSTMDFATFRIQIVNVASMKGLEFDTVFVPDLSAYDEDPSGAAARLQFHVLCTRARDKLHFIYYGHGEPQMVSDVPQSILTRRTG